MQYFHAPMLSASFTPQGKKVRQRLENILFPKSGKKGWILPVCVLSLLMAGSLVACSSARAAGPEAPEELRSEQTQTVPCAMPQPTAAPDADPNEMPLEPALDEPLAECECEPEPEAEPAAPVCFAPPLSGKITVVDTFGQRVHPITRESVWHYGMDLAADEGTPVLASAEGTVTKAEYEAAYGYHVVLTHADGTASIYGHLQSISAEVGKTVAAGEVLGLSGQSGWATGPHLHFELRDAAGAAMDPTGIFF